MFVLSADIVLWQPVKKRWDKLDKRWPCRVTGALRVTDVGRVSVHMEEGKSLPKLLFAYGSVVPCSPHQMGTCVTVFEPDL